MGFDWKRILEISRRGWLHHKPHKEYTLPLISIIGSKVRDRWAKEIYGTTEIEDLWLDFFCVSCNLTRTEMTVFERGALASAVRASGSLPGIFVPVLRDGNVYVDGGVVNNLPGDIMRGRFCERVIVIDVGSAQTFAFKATKFPSPWRLLWSRVVPFAKRLDVPDIGGLLLRTAETSSAKNTAEVKRDADLCLRPPVDTFGVLEFAKIDEIVEVSYRYAADQLEQLRRDPSQVGIFPVAGHPRAG